MKSASNIVNINPHGANPIPPHEVRDERKLARLANSMAADGWIGRPILVLKFGPHYYALTGSHRIAAARIAGLSSIPALTIDRDAWDQWARPIEVSHPSFRYRGFWRGDKARLLESPAWRLLMTSEDDIRPDLLREMGDAAAARLMEVEVEANRDDEDNGII